MDGLWLDSWWTFITPSLQKILHLDFFNLVRVVSIICRHMKIFLHRVDRFNIARRTTHLLHQHKFTRKWVCSGVAFTSLWRPIRSYHELSLCLWSLLKKFRSNFTLRMRLYWLHKGCQNFLAYLLAFVARYLQCSWWAKIGVWSWILRAFDKLSLLSLSNTFNFVKWVFRHHIIHLRCNWLWTTLSVILWLSDAILGGITNSLWYLWFFLYVLV